MNHARIIEEIDAQIERLRQARAALTGSTDGKARRTRHRISAATRKRMAQAMRARWAKVKKAGKSNL